MSDFFTQYDSLSKIEKRELRDKITVETGRRESTFYSWKFRNEVPRYEQTIIAKILNKTVEELFPKP